MNYWDCLKAIIAENEIIIDRKKNTCHPKYKDMIYPVDYGYISGTTSMDGNGIEIFVGTERKSEIQGIACVVDMKKQDSEIKILYKCSEDDVNEIIHFLNISDYMKAFLVKSNYKEM
jgi:inorganic pyrophosphatase